MNEILNTSEKKKSLFITISLHLILFIVFLFSGMHYMDPPINEGSIAITFGEDDYGKNLEFTKQPPQNSQQNSYQENIMTQDTEDASTSIVNTNKKKEETIENLEPDKKTSNTISNFFQESDNSKSQGDDGKYGFKGSKDGDKNSDNFFGNSGNENYKLGNRKPLSKPKPKYNGNDQGTVAVKIIVNSDGKVIKADIEMKGTTITDANLWEEAKISAINTKWEANSDSPRAEGLIIYTFILH